MTIVILRLSDQLAGLVLTRCSLVRIMLRLCLLLLTFLIFNVYLSFVVKEFCGAKGSGTCKSSPQKSRHNFLLFQNRTSGSRRCGRVPATKILRVGEYRIHCIVYNGRTDVQDALQKITIVLGVYSGTVERMKTRTHCYIYD